MAKLNAKNVILSLTIFFTLAYIICRAFFAIWPEQTATFARYLFHGISIEVQPLTFNGFIIGLIETIILSLLSLALFVWIYNKVSKN